MQFIHVMRAISPKRMSQQMSPLKCTVSIGALIIIIVCGHDRLQSTSFCTFFVPIHMHTTIDNWELRFSFPNCSETAVCGHSVQQSTVVGRSELWIGMPGDWITSAIKNNMVAGRHRAHWPHTKGNENAELCVDVIKPTIVRSQTMGI